MVVVNSIQSDSTFAWSNTATPRLALGSVSGKIDANFSNDSILEIWDCFSIGETCKDNSVNNKKRITASSKFMELAWSNDDSVIAGGLDNGVVEFFSPDSCEVIASLKNHNSAVQALAFSSVNKSSLATGDNNGLLNIWDINRIKETGYEPDSLTQSNSNVDCIKSVAFNNRIGHILATAGSSSGYTSIWDVNQKKEILHLGYTNQETNKKVSLDIVQWHPTSGTVVATASNSDIYSSIILWDLRKANTPLEILSNGHSKGVLSLDWCSQDSGLLLSSSSDNTVCLWDPEVKKSLVQVYPPRSNWVFKAKFAPKLPDFFATASHDSQIEVQQLQDLQVDDVVTKVLNKQLSSAGIDLDEKLPETESVHQDDDDFFNSLAGNKSNTQNLSSTESKSSKNLRKVNLSKNISLHVPKWVLEGHKANPSSSWAFGGKMVKINKDGKSVTVFPQPQSISANKNLHKEYNLLQSALRKKDFNGIISKRLNNSLNDNNEEDWTLLDKISLEGKEEFFKESLSIDDDYLNKEKEDTETIEGEEFFEKLEQETFDLALVKEDYEFGSKKIYKNLVDKDYKSAIDSKMSSSDLLEALVIATVSNNDDLKDKVITEFFVKNGSKSQSARLLYALSKSQIEDVIEKSDVSDWRYVARAIKNFTADEIKRTELYITLGNKLFDAGKRQDALILYMYSGELEKVCDIWVDELKDIEEELRNTKSSAYLAHLESLTEFVERFSCFANFFESTNDKLFSNNSKILTLVLEFVNTICINGNFKLAQDFLDILPADNEDVITEKQRVAIASGSTIVNDKQPTHQKYGRSMNQINSASSPKPMSNNSILQHKPQLFTPHQVISGSKSINSASIPKAVSPTPSLAKKPITYNPVETSSSEEFIYNAVPKPATGHAKAAMYAPVQRAVPIKPASSPYGVPTASSVPHVPQQINPYEPKQATQNIKTPAITTPHSFLETPKTATITPAIVPSVPSVSGVKGIVQPQIISNPQKPSNNESLNSPRNEIVSGQKPVGNKHANAGWNDFALPIPNQISRAKAVGIKTENTSSSDLPIKGNSQQYIGSSNGSVTPAGIPKVPIKANNSLPTPPPPISSRASSNKIVADVPKKKAIPEKSTKYAPVVTSNNGNGSSSISTPTTGKVLEPPIPSATSVKSNIGFEAASQPKGFTNPYAPQPSFEKGNKFTPPPPSHISNTSNANAQHITLPPPPIKAKSSAKDTPPLPEKSSLVSEAASSPSVPSKAISNSETQESVKDESQKKNELLYSEEESKKIQEYYKGRVQQFSEGLPEKFSLQIKDTEKRLNILNNHLKKRDLIVSRRVIDILLEISDKIENKDYDSAKALQNEIADDFSEEAGKWLTGIKRFIGFSEASNR